MAAQISIIGPQTKVVGQIHSDAVLIIAGLVEGEVFGAKVIIKDGGRVVGNIHTPSLVIEAGGVFDGRAFMDRDGAEPIPVEAVPPDPFAIDAPPNEGDDGRLED